MVHLDLEIRWEWISVTEDVLNDASVCRSHHRMKSAAVFNFIDVGPCWKVYIGVFLEPVLFSVDDEIDVSFCDYDDQMILWTAWL